jgi:hypothetical protein
MKHFLFDKWGLPIKKQGTEQPASIEQDHLNFEATTVLSDYYQLVSQR